MAVIEDRDERRHPQDEWVPKDYKNREEWRADYDDTNRPAIREGLHYYGPNVPGWDIRDYLEIANGHNEFPGMFGDMPQWTVINKLAQKAFSVLCQKAFNADWMNLCSWWYTTNHDPVKAERFAEKIFWFFGVEPTENGQGATVSNLAEKKHEQETLNSFFDEFLRSMWNLTHPRHERGAIIPKFRRHMLRLTWGLGRLDWLRNHTNVDDEDMEILKGFALECNIYVQTHNSREFLRKAATVKEAVYGRSRAAETYLLLKTEREVKEKLEAEAKRKAEDEAFAREQPLEIMV